MLSLAMLAAGCQWLVVRTGNGRLYSEVGKTPQRDVGLLLGTSEKQGNGNSNPFFEYRIAAAAELYQAGRIRHLLVSGDNHRRDYDEPAMMKSALMAKGVPESAITVDCAGFRTLDSVIRAQKVFGLSKCTIISQRFHNQRALFIARYYGLDALGFCAADVPLRYGLRIQIREALARIKAVLDLYIFHISPKFLGERQKIPLA